MVTQPVSQIPSAKHRAENVTAEDRYVNVGGINTRYWIGGNGTSTLLLIHGLGGYIEAWQPCWNALTTEHRVFILDLPGHGRSDKPLDISYKAEDLAWFVKDFMTALGLERAHLMGHSLGGAVCLKVVANFPKIVDKLVLVDSAGFGREAHIFLRLCSIPFLGEALSRPSREGAEKGVKFNFHNLNAVTSEWLDLNYQMSAQPGAQRAVLKTIRDNGNIFGQQWSLYGPILRDMNTIQHPALVVWGKQDQIIPVAHADVALKGLPNAQKYVFDQCGHLPFAEHPATFNDLVLDFLEA